MNLAECIELVVSKQKYATYKIYINTLNIWNTTSD